MLHNLETTGWVGNEYAKIGKPTKEKCQAIPSFTYLDVYEDLVKGDGINPEYSYDGLHLSKQGYEMISWILKKELK